MKNLPPGLTRAPATRPTAGRPQATPPDAPSESVRQEPSASSAPTPELVLVVPDLKTAEALQKAKAYVVRSTPGGGQCDIRVIVLPKTNPEDVITAKVAALTGGDIIDPADLKGP